MIQTRVGIGYDIHRLTEGRPLILGGIRVDYPRGLLGHSDADAVLHAITDALLGAAGLPDIGEMFPDSDPQWKDADSGVLLMRAMQKVREAGFTAVNVDVIVHAESPKLSAYKSKMSANIARILGLTANRVSIKAKTNEGFGSVGQSDAIACTAVAMIGSET